MNIVDLPLDNIEAPAWNPNEMDEAMRAYLRRSIERFGNLVPLVVRGIHVDRYETVGGAQRLSVLREFGSATAPCVVVAADHNEARLLGQALNHIAGTDNLGLRAQLLRDLLASTPQKEILALLPETSVSLEELTNLGEESIAQALQRWEQIQKARLRHLAFQLTDAQLIVVEQTMDNLAPMIKLEPGNPNRRGNALYILCLDYLEHGNLLGGSTKLEEQS